MNKTLEEMNKYIPDLKEYITKERIGIHPYKKIKVPETVDGKSHSSYWQDQKPYIYYENSDFENFGFIIGYDKLNTGSFLACLDIDGYKKTTDDGKFNWELHQQCCDELYNVLKDIDIKYIAERTWSGGYHFYYFSRQMALTSDIDVLQYIYFPNDFPVEELRGQPITGDTEKVEVLSKPNSKVVIAAPSYIYDQKQEKEGSYTFLSENNYISELIKEKNIVDDISPKLVNVFKKHGYFFDEQAYDKSKNKEINKEYFTNNVELSIDNKDLIDNIMTLYKQGQRNDVGYVLICLLIKKGWSREKIYELFAKLPIPASETKHDLKAVKSWINNKYNTDIKILAGWNEFKKIIDEYIDPEVNKQKVVNFFTKFLKPHKKQDVYKFNDEYSLYTKDQKTYWIKTVTGEKVTPIISSTKPLSEYVGTRNKTIMELILKKDKTIDKFELETFLDNIAIQVAELEEQKASNPWVTLALKPQDTGIHQQIAPEVEKKYGIIKVIDEKSHYWFNPEKVYYEEMTWENLGLLIEQDFYPKDFLKTIGIEQIAITKKPLESILSAIKNNKKMDNNLWVFSNVLFDARQYGYITDFKENYLTTKKIARKTEDKEYDLLEFQNDVKLINEGDDETFVEKSLKKTLIPKDNPEDTSLYIDYLQRLGACLLNINISKSIPIYVGMGNNGKSILVDLPKHIFNDHYRSIDINTFFKDNFKIGQIKNTNMIVIDEIKTNDFREPLVLIKRLSGGGVSIMEREMFKANAAETDNYGMLWVATNHIPNVPLDEEAFFNRADILKLPNVFKPKEEIGKNDVNVYPENGNIKQQLQQDKDGLSWLISAAIQAYESIYLAISQGGSKRFECSQTAHQTKQIIASEDTILSFLILYTEEQEGSSVSNKELTIIFEEYLTQTNTSYGNNKSTIPSQIGSGISILYPHIRKNSTTTGTKYVNLKINTHEDVEIKKTHIYTLTDEDMYIEENSLLAPDEKIILKDIKQGHNTINNLQKQHELLDVPMILQNLESKGIVNNNKLIKGD